MDENDLDVADDQGVPYDTNLSDVIEVIEETDPDFKETANQRQPTQQQMTNNKMYNGGGEIPHKPVLSQSAQQNSRRQAHVEIVEQPAAKALRFRYECEGRSAGSIPGASSSSDNKTFPSIRVVGYQGRAVVVVSCVTKDAPYKAHPHNLVGREGCRRGVCTLEIPPDTMMVQFSNLGIQCVKKRDIESALRVREEIRVDPFRQGFNHRSQPTSIDLNAVRLCFQVFLEGDTPRKFTVPLPPVVSEPIYDKKAMSDLTIIKLSHCVSYVDGGRNDIILLCEKVAKEDIQIRFYEERDGNVVWEGFADFQPSQVHKQHAIWFRTPRYHTLDITEPVNVFIQLRRPSDGVTSEPLQFQLLPLDSVTLIDKGRRKRPKIGDSNEILRHLQEPDKKINYQLNIPMDTIKTEPRESTSPYVYGGVSPGYGASPNVSPQYNLPLDNIASTPSPDNIRYQYHNPGITLMAGGVSPQNWNIPTTSGMNLPTASGMNIPSTSAMNIQVNHVDSNIPNSLLDLDTMQVNSSELNSCLNIIRNEEQLPEINSLSLSDINGQLQDQNMTDSLTRLANNTIDSLCQLNNNLYQ